MLIQIMISWYPVPSTLRISNKFIA